MKHTVINKTALKQKSDVLGIPFSNLLAGFVLESLMYLIETSEFADTLWLKNVNIFGVEQYRKKNLLTLEFAYLTDEKVIKKGELRPGQKLSFNMGCVMLAYILKKEKVPEIKWMARPFMKENALDIQLTGEFEEMIVPLRIRVDEITGEEIIPMRKHLALFMDPKQNITYLEYPSDKKLSELLFLVIRDMELIAEMSVYDQIYTILSQEAVDGRRVREMIREYCIRENIPTEKERMDTVLSYRHYAYMRKRWEKYLRHNKRKEPDWDAVMKKIGGFLPRVWKSICRDEIFFGDWMPGLGRFLE